MPLLVIGGLCGILLVLTNQFTATDIQANREARTRALLEAMLGQPLPAQTSITEAIFGNCEQWLFVRTSSAGYAGPIYLTALWRAGSSPAQPGRLSLRVIDHRETPGIGDFIDHTRDPWITELDNSNAAAYAHLDAVTGATITSNAIRRAADRIFNQVEVYCEQQ
ncbi:MAG: FMN-binding protein [bacterium]